MKIRKILPVLLVAIASVVMLSSCDAILDVIFSNNTVTVYATSYIPTHGYYPNYDVMTVTVTGPNTASGTAAYTGSDGLYMYWSLQIPKLTDGTYSVNVSYYHPYGIGPSSANSTQIISFPASSGNPHNTNLSFNF